ncbi:MAG: hypothetical protein BGO98_07725 [Myxococcales bacterium 68-20]|nr:hypothetical protein [Myxococcales bacterium]OJY28730.1 MAG: hypothetical protein BGO98_07725 [Myxococcales bacterium 68-20]
MQSWLLGRGSTLLSIALVACSSTETAPTETAHDAGASIEASVPVDPGASDAGASPKSDASVVRCEAGTRTGAAGTSEDLTTDAGLHFSVRTPSDYDPLRGSPLIVMFAPSGGTAASIEASTKLTPDALGAGFVVAYVDTVSPTNIAGAKDAAGIPSRIAERWCIDRERVYLTGSSDGGGLIYTIVLNHYMTPEPAAVAPFAAGASKNTLAKATCLAPPMPVMVMHNSGDAVFPKYGQAARDWWVSCNACGDPETLADGCLAYRDCADGGDVRYCEGEGGHGRWPGLHSSMFEFFLAHTRAAP